jgi:hypothetical protein
VVQAETADGKEFRLKPVTDPVLRQAARAVADKLEASRTGIGTAAEKWVPGISALLGLFGLVTIVVARDAASALSWGLRVVMFGLVCLALACAASATISIYRAAFGWPKKINLSSDADVIAVAKEVANQAEIAGKKLRSAVILAAVSTAALLGALGILWLQPAPGATAMALLDFTTPGTGATVLHRCVQIDGVANGMLQVKVIDGGSIDSYAVALTDVLKLVPASCKGK